MTPPIPAAVLEHHVAILGKTGSGKSNVAKTFVEWLLSQGERVCAIDPTGTWWGLRLDKKGGKSPFEPVIFGGNHADIPISAEHGAAIAEAIGTSSTSAIIDTRLMTVGKRTQFFTDFADGLLRSNRGPLHLVIDEAHLFAPQGRVNDPRSGAMLHAANNLVSLGRGIGLRIILISQRPAKLHKDSLTQVETLIAMRLIAPQDRSAVEDWIRHSADPSEGKEIIASLASLPTGDAWVWSPEIEMLERVHFPLASTMDTGSATDQSEAALPPIDLDAMTERLGAIREDVIANDPARLKKQIADLQRQLAKGGASQDDIAKAEKAGFDRGLAEGEKHAATQYQLGRADGFRLALSRVNSVIADIDMPAVEVANPVAPRPAPKPSKTAPATDDDLKLNAQAMLSEACKRWPVKMSWTQLATLTGRKARGGAFNTARKQLLERNLVLEDGNLVKPTPEAFEHVGIPIPGVADLASIRDGWLEALPNPANAMLEIMFNFYPGSMTKEELANRMGKQPRGGHWNSGMKFLRDNDLITDHGGEIRAANHLFGKGD